MFGVIMMLIIVGMLSFASFQGVAKFRELTKSVRDRTMELPEAAELGNQVSRLRSLLSQMNHQPPELAINQVDQSQFLLKLMDVEIALRNYETQLQSSQAADPRIAEKKQETEFVIQFRKKLKRIRRIADEEDFTAWVWHQEQIYTPLESELSELQTMAAEIPVFMQQRMDRFADRAKTEYRTWFGITAFLVIAAVGLIGLLIWKFSTRIIAPLEKLVAGSREVAGGNYDHRIELNSEDEVAELGKALNLSLIHI